jgi:hypothetical protein
MFCKGDDGMIFTLLELSHRLYWSAICAAKWVSAVVVAESFDVIFSRFKFGTCISLCSTVAALRFALDVVDMLTADIFFEA